MKTLFCSLLAIFWLFLPLSTSAITLKGEVKNYAVQEVLLNVLFGRFHLLMDDIIIPVDDQGKFHYELQTNEIRFAELKFGNRGSIQLLLDPGSEYLSLEVDINDIPGSLTFIGATAAANEYINQRPFPIYHDKLRTLPLQQQSIPELVDDFAREEEPIELGILEEIREDLNELVYQLLRREIKAYYLTLRIQAGNNIGWQDPEAYAAHWMMRNEGLGREIDCMEENKYSPNYNHLIHTYYDHLRIKYYIDYPNNKAKWHRLFDVTSQPELKVLKEHDKYNIDLYVLGKEGFCPPIFEKLLSNCIFRSQMEGDFVNLIRIYEAFRELFPESPYLTKLEAGMDRIYEFEKIREAAAKDIHFQPRMALESGILSVLQQEKYRGKVLLLDFWGTWCGPCRDEFPHLKKVKGPLRNEDIVYLYFASEVAKDPEENWMKTAKFYGLKGDHYLTRKEDVFQFLEDIDQYHPSFEYPTYMIVDRKGKVVDMDAPKPSDTENLIAAIQSVLGKK